MGPLQLRVNVEAGSHAHTRAPIHHSQDDMLLRRRPFLIDPYHRPFARGTEQIRIEVSPWFMSFTELMYAAGCFRANSQMNISLRTLKHGHAGGTCRVRAACFQG